ncbi:MAG: acyltransferase [Proteobacteria bacterium]|nr:acyltransferase [Pseudomonadota bacterium]
MSDKGRGKRQALGLPVKTHRADIDGLRAVAILGVLGYHFGLGVPGGYGGVDVFFVISGFLIAGIIKSELEAGTFSLANFYVRRIRRILPALAVCLLVTTIAAATILFPFDFVSYARSLRAVATATSNFFFEHRASNYFGAVAIYKPLMHTWSLSIEEQFYAAFPLLVMLLHRFRRGYALPAMALAAALSLAFSVHLLTQSPERAFFSLAGRIWELLCGTMLAFGLLPQLRSRSMRETTALLGALMIVGCYFIYSDETLFPGLAALPLCIGAILIIYSGTGASDESNLHQTMVARLLSAPPFVAIGLISYSVYLWHWPLLVLTRYRFETLFDDGGGFSTALVLATASLLLGALSWRFVEQPFRGRLASHSAWKAYAGAFATFAITLGVAQLIVKKPAWFHTWPKEVIALGAHGRDPKLASFFGPPASRKQGWPKGIFLVGDGSSIPGTFLWGDSHAMAMLPGMKDYLNATRRRILISADPSCPPLINVSFHGDRYAEACKARNDRVLAAILKSDIRDVVLVGRWIRYARLFDPKKRVAKFQWGDAAKEKAFGEMLEETVQTLVDHGKSVVIAGPIPEQHFDVTRSMMRHAAWNEPLPNAETVEDFRRDERKVLDVLARLDHIEGVSVVYPDRALCDDRICPYLKDNIGLYFDDNHLSVAGARELRPVYAQMFASQPENETHAAAE